MCNVHVVSFMLLQHQGGHRRPVLCIGRMFEGHTALQSQSSLAVLIVFCSPNRLRRWFRCLLQWCWGGLGASWGGLGASWVALGRVWGGLRASGGCLGRLLGYLDTMNDDKIEKNDFQTLQMQNLPPLGPGGRRGRKRRRRRRRRKRKRRRRRSAPKRSQIDPKSNPNNDQTNDRIQDGHCALWSWGLAECAGLGGTS